VERHLAAYHSQHADKVTKKLSAEVCEEFRENDFVTFIKDFFLYEVKHTENYLQRENRTLRINVSY
jgi:hypothetical protein